MFLVYLFFFHSWLEFCCTDAQLVHLQIDGYLYYFQFCEIISTFAINIHRKVALQIHKYPGMGIAGLCNTYIFEFRRNAKLFPKCPCHVIHWATIYGSSSDFTSLPALDAFALFLCFCLFLVLFLVLAILGGVQWPLVVALIYVSLMINKNEHFLHVLCHLYIFFGEVFIQMFCPYVPF